MYKSFSSNDQLVDYLVQIGAVHCTRVVQALRQVDRKNYAPSNPYQDRPQHIACNQTISAPSMHAVCLEELADVIKEGSRVLDVGCGSGYLCSVFGVLVGHTGKVVGIDMYPEIIQQARVNIDKDHPELLSMHVVELIVGDGWKGDPMHGPFDAIHVGAAADCFPSELFKQLKPGGRMIVPIGPLNSIQYLERIDKDEMGMEHRKSITGCRYVPLQHLSSVGHE